MREISADTIKKAISKLCMDSNYNLNDDILSELQKSLKIEESETGKDIIKQLIENANIARVQKKPICQDTGMTVVFIEIGQEVHIIEGNLTDAINEGVRDGYDKGYLRKSVVKDPIFRENTNDNTPAIIHYEIVNGNKIKIDVVPKGFGSENMSMIKMLKPSDGIEGIKASIIDCVKNAGANPCPPIIVGVGIGGTMEKAAIIAKKALIRPINKSNKIEYIANLEEEMKNKINDLGIGPSGLGGRITTLGVNIEVFPTHIAGLPIAINISCHATRHAKIII